MREIYADSDAVLAHMGNMGDTLGQLVEPGGGLEVEVFHNPSAVPLDVDGDRWNDAVFPHSWEHCWRR